MLLERANSTVSANVPFFVVSEDAFSSPVVANAQEDRPLSRWVGRGDDLGLSLLCLSAFSSAFPSSEKPLPGSLLPFTDEALAFLSPLTEQLQTQTSHTFPSYSIANDSSLPFPASHLTAAILAKSLRKCFVVSETGGGKKKSQSSADKSPPGELLRGEEIIVGMGGKLAMQELEKIAPLSSETKSFFFVDGWKDLGPDILAWSGLIREENALYSQSQSIFSKQASSHEGLRKFFRSNWKGTQKAFSTEYGGMSIFFFFFIFLFLLLPFFSSFLSYFECVLISSFSVNQGNFSSWLNGKTESPASRAAVLRFQATQQP